MMKVVRTVWSGGKTGDNIKCLPITIGFIDKNKASYTSFYKEDNLKEMRNNLMVSRLRKIAEQQNANQESFVDEVRREVIDDIKNKNTSNMDLLNELDEADVRHDRCPICKDSLVRKKGFKVCIGCGAVYKIMEGKCYSVRG